MYRIINKFYNVLCRVTKVSDTHISFSCEGEDLIIDKLNPINAPHILTLFSQKSCTDATTYPYIGTVNRTSTSEL